MNKKDLSTWLEETFEKKIFKHGEKIPSEKELSKKFNLSNQQIKTILNKYIKLGALISFQGKGVYISPTFQEFKNRTSFIPIKQNIIEPKFTTRIIGKIEDYPMLEIIKKRINIKYDPKKWEVIVEKFYDKQKNIVSYSINWINKHCNFSAKYLANNPSTNFEDLFGSKLIETHTYTVAPTPYDQLIFGNSVTDYTPTSFTSIYEKEVTPIVVRETKVIPKYFETINRFVNK